MSSDSISMKFGQESLEGLILDVSLSVSHLSCVKKIVLRGFLPAAGQGPIRHVLLFLQKRAVFSVFELCRIPGMMIIDQAVNVI